MLAGGGVEGEPSDAGLHGRVQLVGAQREEPIHLREREGDAAGDRDHVALEARPGAEGHDRHSLRRREGEHAGDLVRALGEDDDVGPSRRVQAQVAAMLVEHRVAVDDAPLVGQELEESGTEAHGSTIVTGPSLTSSTSMRAPKTPCSTATPRSRSAAQNRS